MSSGRCCIIFWWLAIIMNLVHYCSTFTDTKSLGDVRSNSMNARTPEKRELTTDLPEVPQADMYSPRPNVPRNHPCYPFSVADFERQQFFSPGYPAETYTNNSDCILVLEAPPGSLVKLDFRDWFAIEPSPDCKNDFLEVRDGPYGFNNLIDKPFCGFDFPQELTSTDRHLWIHFKSDENIEYKGFRAVFEFVQRSRSTSIETPEILPCRIDLHGLEEGFLGKSNISTDIAQFNDANGMPTDCIWAITVREGRRIQLQFQKFSLEKPNECDSNFVQVFSNQTDIPNMEKMFCGSIADAVTSKNHIMFLRFFSEPRGTKSTFEANFTEFRDLEKGSDKQICFDDEFDCEDATCISKLLRCNGRYNCRHRWDEDDCYNAKSLSLSEDHIVVIMVIFSLILTGMCVTFLFNCVKKLIKDHHSIQEYIRQSREQQLNQLDKQNEIEQHHRAVENKSGSRSMTNTPTATANCRHHFTVPVDVTSTPCYVPGGEILPILVRNEHATGPNGDVYNHGTSVYTLDTSGCVGGEPQMCDSACQTRESLFDAIDDTYSSNSFERDSTVGLGGATVRGTPPPAPFSTFGYKSKDSRYRAEASINVETPQKGGGTASGAVVGNAAANVGTMNKRRPYSVQTTKSAPDVIVTH